METFKLTPGTQPNIQVEDIRRYIRDTDPEYNILALDLKFSDQDIMDSMNDAIMRYNSTPPFTNTYTINNCKSSYAIKNGTAYELMQKRYQDLSSKLMQYSGGGMEQNNIQAQIQHVTAMIKHFNDVFIEHVKQEKMARNLQRCMGVQIG